MLAIDGGSFVIGRADREPNERGGGTVQVRAFALDVTEVTTAAYTACVRAGVCRRPIAPAGTRSCNFGSDRLDHPINCVDHHDAETFCTWARKRLPTEAEWEFAARGGGDSEWPWGDVAPEPTTDRACWARRGSGQEGTCPVGRHVPGRSRQGLLDLAGNVWEWTSSRYGERHDAPPAADRWVVKGGGWFTVEPHWVSTTARHGELTDFANHDVGFRCAR